MASLPYADVDAELRALAGRAEGFGRQAIGGLHGSIYTVTTLAGSLLFYSPPLLSEFLMIRFRARYGFSLINGHLCNVSPCIWVVLV